MLTGVIKKPVVGHYQGYFSSPLAAENPDIFLVKKEQVYFSSQPLKLSLTMDPS